MLSYATFYDRINTIYKFIKPFLVFEEYGAFKYAICAEINVSSFCIYKSYSHFFSAKYLC